MLQTRNRSTFTLCFFHASVTPMLAIRDMKLTFFAATYIGTTQSQYRQYSIFKHGRISVGIDTQHRRACGNVILRDRYPQSPCFQSRSAQRSAASINGHSLRPCSPTAQPFTRQRQLFQVCGRFPSRANSVGQTRHSGVRRAGKSGGIARDAV